jgi:zinc resistance-associated protein
MEMTPIKKKIMLAAILTSGLTLAISQATLAETAKPAQPAPQSNSAALPCQVLMSSEMQKAHDKFLTDTVAIRKELAEKNAVMRALMQAGTPDTVKASQVAGELFELREKLRAKAQEAGLPMPMLMMGQDGDGMGCQGMMGHRGMAGKHHRMMN